MKIEDFILKIKRKWMKLRLQPIRVFCFHQVSDFFDDNSMYRQDWLQTEEFKGQIKKFQEAGYTFISITEAREKLRHDTFRFKKYAVLTADDGWASIKNILPWLNEQQIPVTLFLNPLYFDGKHYRNRETEKYLSEEEVKQLHQYPLLTIGSHGWAHLSAVHITEEAFVENVDKSIEALKKLPNYIPYFAYTWGWHTDGTDKLLLSKGLYIANLKGSWNYHSANAMDREVLNTEIKI